MYKFYTCSVPDLEEIPNPDSTDYPSSLGQNYENRDCTRVLTSNVSKSSFHPLHSMKISEFICLKIIHFHIIHSLLNKWPNI